MFFYWLFTFSLEKNFRVCLSIARESYSNRISIDKEIKCSNAYFIDQSTLELGGALFINNTDNILKIDSCLFLKCSSFVSHQLVRNCSGGALFCILSFSEIKKSNFVECFGVSTGIVAYISGNKNFTSILEECSASKMKCTTKESTTSDTNVAYMIDFCSNIVSKVNFSKPINLAHSFFFGQNPPKLTISKVSISGDKMERGLELSSDNEQVNISSIVFEGMSANQSLFCVWTASFSVSNVHVINCQGNLASSIRGGQLKIKNSWVGKGININSSVITLGEGVIKEDSTLESTLFVEHFVNNVCSVIILRTPKLIHLSLAFCKG